MNFLVTVVLCARHFCNSREQHATIKFCFLLGNIGTETLEMLKTVYKMVLLRKFFGFKTGEMLINDKPRSGRPSMARTYENVEKFVKLSWKFYDGQLEKVEELSGVICDNRTISFSTTITPLLTQPCSDTFLNVNGMTHPCVPPHIHPTLSTMTLFTLPHEGTWNESVLPMLVR